MGKFCYLGVMLTVDGSGDDDAAVGARVRKGWNEFRQLLCICFRIRTSDFFYLSIYPLGRGPAYSGPIR